MTDTQTADTQTADTHTADTGAAAAGPADLTAPMRTLEFRADPYPFYARMRNEDPVHRSPEGIWHVTRYADVEAALGDLRLSNDRDRMTTALAARDSRLKDLSKLAARLGRVMTNTDPPDHARLRKLVNKAFTARRIEALRDGIRTIVDGLVDEALAAGRTADLIEAVAAPLPLTVICELFGVPAADRARVKVWFRALSNLGEDFEQAEAVIDQFEEYLSWLVRERRSAPGDDLISALVAAQARGDHLTDAELLSTCFMLITAGDDTTTNLIGNGTLALLRNPGQLALLREDPALIRPAMDELVRYDTPTQVIIRVVAEELDLAGRTLGVGDLVYLVLGSTNRDERRFTDPDRLDLARPDNRHLSFGNGPHFCLGGPLARLEAELAIGTLVRRMPALRLDTDTPQWKPNPLQRRLTALPVAY